ncbi:MAG: hypothetical protein ACFE8V_11445 [Promethearchaeota archaeon]
MSDLHKNSGTQTTEERSTRYYNDWLDGKRVIACFIDQENDNKWYDYYTGAEASCIKKGTLLFDSQYKIYYKIKELFFTIDASELYVYVEQVLQEDLDILRIRYDLTQGPEWKKQGEKKVSSQVDSKVDQYNLYYL